jgi:hypothetical protein
MTSHLVLVHGAWHGGWAFDSFRRELASRDITTSVVELASVGHDGELGGDLYVDAALMREAVDRLPHDCVVLAHSYGGVPVTQGLEGATNVKGLIFLTAFMLPVGVSLFDACGAVDPPWWVRNEANTWVVPATPEAIFYNTTSPEDTSQAVARLGTQSLSSFTQPVTSASWSTIPSTYIICERDQAIPLFAQEAMAANATRVARLGSDHSPFLSDKVALANLVTDIMGATD